MKSNPELGMAVEIENLRQFTKQVDRSEFVIKRADLWSFTIAYLYRRMLENDAEDTTERIKTCVIILEGMTRLKITESFEGLLHICLLITGWVILILMSLLTSNYTSFSVEISYCPLNKINWWIQKRMLLSKSKGI